MTVPPYSVRPLPIPVPPAASNDPANPRANNNGGEAPRATVGRYCPIDSPRTGNITPGLSAKADTAPPKVGASTLFIRVVRSFSSIGICLARSS